MRFNINDIRFLLPILLIIIFIPQNSLAFAPPNTPYITIDIISTPEGAQIWMEGKDTGKLTPNTIYIYDTGDYNFSLILEGYQPHQMIIYISKSMTKKVTLTPVKSTSLPISTPTPQPIDTPISTPTPRSIDTPISTPMPHTPDFLISSLSISIFFVYLFIKKIVR